MENVWRYSRPVDLEAVHKTPSFTTLPVRINKRQDVANEATSRALREWDAAFQDGLAARALISFSDLGNLGAFAYPEADPERLHILTYLTDLGMLHDDGYESMDMDTARLEHRELGLLFDPKQQHQPSPNTRAPKIKKLVSQMLLEATAIDREMGMYMFNTYNKGWLAVAGEAKDWNFDSVEEYQAYRRNDFGATAFWAMTEFAVGIRLSDDDRKLIAPIMEPIEKAVVWTNDYWSFDRENYEASVNGNRLVNVVEVIRRCGDLSIDDAKARARKLLVDTEQEYVRNKELLFANNPSLSLDLKRWVELVGAIVGGTHYWASSAPRHRAWTKAEEEMAKPANDQTLDGWGGQHVSSEESTTPDCGSDSSSQQTPATELSNDKSPGSQSPDLSKVDTGPESDCQYFNKHMESPEILEPTLHKPATTALQAPIDYICAMPSKGVRSTLIDALNYWLKVDETQLENIKDLVSFLHNASLILDDIEDSSPKRRGQPATHILFGHAQAINSANYMFVRAVQATRHFRNPQAVDILLEELENLYQGQSWDLRWKYDLTCPSIDEYTNMIDNKTGGMFRLLSRLMQVEAGPRLGRDCVQGQGLLPLLDRLTTLFGRFFQIRDDYMNLYDGSYAQQKGDCEDLDEGKFSYPIVYCATNYPDFKSIIHGVFRQRPASATMSAQPLPPEIKKYVINILDSSGTFQHCREYLIHLEHLIVEAIGKIENVTQETNPVLRLLLQQLSLQ